jgi:hypothetical protein
MSGPLRQASTYCSSSYLLRILQQISPTWQLGCKLGWILPAASVAGEQQQHQGLGCQQAYSSTAGQQQQEQQQQQATSLKSALRQLYKRVHPDLFTDYPAEQVSNGKSALASDVHTSPLCVSHIQQR